MVKTDLATLNNLRTNEHDIQNIQLLPIKNFVFLLTLYDSFCLQTLEIQGKNYKKKWIKLRLQYYLQVLGSRGGSYEYCLN
jgi:hypothetical protein